LTRKAVSAHMDAFQKISRTAFVNFLHAKVEMYSGKLHVGSLPYYLSVDPSDKCQLRCPTCPTGMENESRRAHSGERVIFRTDRRKLDEPLFDALLEELGEYLFLVMFYNYGEPLLNPKLPGFIRKAKHYRIETELHSNLSLPLSDDRLEDLLTSGLDRLLASIDGFSQETYQIHRVGGDFVLAKGNLERLAKLRDRLGLHTQISYGFLVFSFNEHERRDAEAYCRDLGIDFQVRDAFVDDHAWLPSYRKQEAPWSVPTEAQLKKDASVGWSPLPQVQTSRSPSACGWHYGYSVVTAGGRVAPCCAVAKEAYDLGQITPGQVSFGDVWNNDRYRRSRGAFAGQDVPELADVDTVCTRCPYPRGIQHLYSVHDAKVLRQFQLVFAGTDPTLEQAFDLFSQVRYGVPLNVMARNGPLAPNHLFVGRESTSDTAAFVDFCEKNIAS
jgi:MoaA/NifB/PqqE/SkfB family radical SAM enzyme